MEHFIPIRRTDLISLCANDGTFTNNNNSADFLEFAEALSALFHFEGYKRLEILKDAYAPVNPDRDTKLLHAWSSAELDDQHKALTKTLDEVIQAANFVRITADDLRDALHEESLFKVRLSVNFDDFEEVLFYRRGESLREAEIRTWWGLGRRTIRFTNYDRVVVYVRFHQQYSGPIDNERLQQASKTPASGQTWTPGAVMLKLFKNVPKADLEMLFPNTEVRMKMADKLAIGVPALVSGFVVATTKLGGTALLLVALVAFWLGWREQSVTFDQAALIALGGGVAALAGYLWKQFSSFKNRKIRFMKALADNLYFKNLDNNVGVFHRLIDAAEEEECKEVLLAYFHLLIGGTQTESELDHNVEQWLMEKCDCTLDFEMADAVRKLERLGLVTEERVSSAEPRVLKAVPIATANETIAKQWRGYFDDR